MHIALFNVKYSANLGDGLLSECLETELKRASDSTTVTCLDLAGRLGYGEGGQLRRLALACLDRSPTILRRTLVETVLGSALRRRMRPYWRHALRNVDAVVVGGGNLFGDADLNFPLKIHAALSEARMAGVPAAVFGVGVSDNWSPRGETLFREALSGLPLVHASVREARSAAIWDRRLGPIGLPPVAIVQDPGLLIADHVPPRRRAPPERPLVGIGLTHPLVLRYHGADRQIRAGALTDWFVDLVHACHRQGWRICLFTNGSPEDDQYLNAIRLRLGDLESSGRLSIAPRFLRPAELAAFISDLDILLAHRLHANIAAYSYRVPHIGFAWDEKLRSFFTAMRRPEYMCTAGVDPPEQVVRLARDALDVGIDPQRHRTMLGQARHNVVQLSATLHAAVASATEQAPPRRAPTVVT